jgi:hypothetical protein
MVSAKDKPNREPMLAEARRLSKKITDRTIAAGISQQEIENRAYEAFLDVKRNRRSGRN